MPREGRRQEAGRAWRTCAVNAVKVSLGATATTGPVVQLFSGDYLNDPGYSNWHVAPDGKHFLTLQNVDRQEETIVLYNWAAELRKGWK